MSVIFVFTHPGCFVPIFFSLFQPPCQEKNTFRSFTALFSLPLGLWLLSGYRRGAHRQRRSPAGQQHCVCRLRSVRQRHPGGPQHRLRPQLLHAGPGELLFCPPVVTVCQLLSFKFTSRQSFSRDSFILPLSMSTRCSSVPDFLLTLRPSASSS